MFISFEQLIVLLVLAFILFGPEKLPQYAATLGRWVARLRQTSTELTQQYQNPFQYPPAPPPPHEPYVKECTCPHCHRPLDHDFTFCPHCGHRRPEESGSQKPAAIS